ncbi:hypothetical protein [Brumimicrobium aurantiacum]|uniref:hypothetical protein n=1 Tax=Brumimicrobium aurantiacum TaxID=1737063 RepID=UPI001403A060|nr:hypothetical protein [Brumimicrobium aurantiacum]
MEGFIVISVVVMAAYVVKLLIDINLLTFKISKQHLAKVENEMEKDYEFIKGLY